MISIRASGWLKMQESQVRQKNQVIANREHVTGTMRNYWDYVKSTMYVNVGFHAVR